jgi:hypothetical protein
VSILNFSSSKSLNGINFDSLKKCSQESKSENLKVEEEKGSFESLSKGNSKMSLSKLIKSSTPFRTNDLKDL